MIQLIKLIISLFLRNSDKSKPESKPEPKPESKPEPEPIITMEMVATSSGRYPQRAKSPEFTDEVKNNINKLIVPVNKLLNELKVTKVDITSGFRTLASNAAIANSAKKSNHMRGLAIDILDDKNQSLGKQITLELLEKYDLYMEDLAYTKGKNTNWVHIQATKTASGRRIFKP